LLVLNLTRQPATARLLDRLLADPEIRARALHGLSNSQAAAASFQTVLASEPFQICGFDDLSWLLASNVLNHGLARQEVAEAAYLYRLVSERSHAPLVAEIGRYTGGSTFLLAAAGATVLSLDIREPRPGADAELRAALERFGLASRVEIETAAALEYELNGRRFDLVFYDRAGPADEVRAELAKWWTALKPGGSLIIRDGAGYPNNDVRAAIVDGVRTATADFAAHTPAARRIPGTPGSYAHFVNEEQSQRNARPARRRDGE